MQIYHPNRFVYGLPPENVFYVADEAGQPMGEALLIPSYHPDLFPERPASFHMQIKAVGTWRDILLGALLARTQQLREEHPELKSRAYAQVSPKDQELLHFFAENGFDSNDGVDIVDLSMPGVHAATPMGYQMGFTPTDNQQNQVGLIGRMNPYRLNPWTLQQIQGFVAMPHFLAMNIVKGDTIAGEIVLIGRGSSARLMGLYVLPAFRRRNLAKILIACAMQHLMADGVTKFEGEVIRRSQPQTRLAQSCGATFQYTAFFCPGIDYE